MHQYPVAMDTRCRAAHVKNCRSRDRQIRQHVATLVKYLEHVIHDIKYIVGDLQVLLEQIDLVTRQLDEPVPMVGVAERTARSSDLVTANLSQRVGCQPLTRTKGLNTKLKSSSPSKKSKKHFPVEGDATSSKSSVFSFDDSLHGQDENGFDFDRSSVEFNAMWDTEYDKDLILGQWHGEAEQDTFLTFDTTLDRDKVRNARDNLTKFETSCTSWMDSSLEHSLTSGIDMLTFTDDSDEDVSAFGKQGEDRCNISRGDTVKVDPYHICCKEVIPQGSDSTYCGVYEAVLEACLERCGDIDRSDSFHSGVYISEDEELESVHSGCTYEPRYDMGINPWTAFTMVPLDSFQSSEDELSETSSDILNDNIVGLSRLMLNNLDNKTSNSHVTTDTTRTSGSADTHNRSLLVC